MPQRLAITGPDRVDCSMRITTTLIIRCEIVEYAINIEDVVVGTKVKTGNTIVPEYCTILCSQGHQIRIHISHMPTHTGMKIEHIRSCQRNASVKGLFPDQITCTRIQDIDMAIC